jgi:hypothetical protein
VNIGRHIAAFEDDEDAFIIKIKPFEAGIISPPLATSSSPLVLLDEEDVPVRQVAKRNRWAK